MYVVAYVMVANNNIVPLFQRGQSCRVVVYSVHARHCHATCCCLLVSNQLQQIYLEVGILNVCDKTMCFSITGLHAVMSYTLSSTAFSVIYGRPMV